MYWIYNFLTQSRVPGTYDTRAEAEVALKKKRAEDPTGTYYIQPDDEE